MIVQAALALAKAYTTYLERKLEFTAAMQEVLSEAGMGCFIAHESGNDKVLESYLRLIDAWLKAYLAVMTPSQFLSCFGGEIVNTPWLDAWFSQFSEYRKWKNEYMQRGGVPWWLRLDEAFIRTVCSVRGLLEYIKDIWLYLLRPQFLEEEYYANVVMGAEARDKRGESLIQYLQRKFPLTKVDWSEAWSWDWVWRLVNPVVDLDWAVFKATLALFTAYTRQWRTRLLRLLIPPYLFQQRVACYTEEGFRQDVRVDDYGQFRVSGIPLNHRKLIIDTYGLKYELNLPWFNALSRLQLKKHCSDPQYAGGFDWKINHEGGYLDMYSCAGCEDQQYAFFYAPREEWEGVRIRGRVYFYSYWVAPDIPFEIRDGIYKRHDPNDFPPDQHVPLKGNGVLARHWWLDAQGYHDFELGPVNVDNISEPYATFMVYFTDTWRLTALDFRIYWLEAVDSYGNVLARLDFKDPSTELFIENTNPREGWGLAGYIT